MPQIEVQVHFAEGLDLPFAPERVEQTVLLVLDAEGVEAAEVSVTFVDDAEIERVNREYLDHEGATDVISFPLHLEDGPPLGDIYVGVEQARRQADDLAVSFDEELLRLTIHGTLHILGYEHPHGEERVGSAMFERQEALLRLVLANARPRLQDG